jgi:hypothetical protein
MKLIQLLATTAVLATGAKASFAFYDSQSILIEHTLAISRPHFTELNRTNWPQWIHGQHRN